jgi:hypothetical protein
VLSSELAELNEKLVPLRVQIAPIVEQLENRQTIAILAQDEAVLPLLIEEHSVAMIIKTDDELRYMIKSLEHFYMLPKSKQKTIFGASTFDAEAVYYQACQAMEYAKSVDDINTDIHRVKITREGIRTSYQTELLESRRYPSLWLPIPYMEIRKSPLMVQNEGWESWK